MTKDRIVMVKRAKPKKVRLPDGRTFVARYKRATKQRAAPKGKRRQLGQRGRAFKSAFGKVVKLAKKVGKNKTFRKVARNVLQEVPGFIQGLSQKTKNKKIKALLDNDYTRTGLDLAAGYAIDKLK